MGIDEREASQVNGTHQMTNKITADNFQSKERHTHTGTKGTQSIVNTRKESPCRISYLKHYVDIAKTVYWRLLEPLRDSAWLLHDFLLVRGKDGNQCCYNSKVQRRCV